MLRFPHSFPIVFLLVVAASRGLAIAQEEISFNQQVRPILTSICFNCHGPDEASNEGGLRLDSLDVAQKEGDSGEPAIVPGSSKQSELIRRIFDEDDPMPPTDFPKQLTAEQKETLKRWVEQGANYEGHWAFAKPTRPAIPELDSQWAINPVDHFVLKKMKSKGLNPSPEASRRTLIRRLALDLTGLPPTPQEITEFVTDDSPDAYEKMVDRYLSSEAYGEMMARPWLDHARYADSNGFQADGSRDMWAWREWVIKAYNRNLPFDQFTIDQLAGDMLPNPTRDQMIATGFNRNHRLNGEGGRIVDEWFVETVIDRVETTGLTWLGLTYNCCRCHDHKYDPISQKEFFEMFAFFNSVEESGVLDPVGKDSENTPPLFQLSTPQQKKELAKFDRRISEFQSQLDEVLKEEQQPLEQWIKSLEPKKQKGSPWKLARIKSLTCKQGTKLETLPDNSVLASGKNPDNPTYEIEFNLGKEKLFSGLMIEALPDGSSSKNSLGRGPGNGNFVLTDIVCEIKKDDNRKTINFTAAEANFSQASEDADSVLIEEDLKNSTTSKKGWSALGFEASQNQSNRIMFTVAEPLKVKNNSTVMVKLYHRSANAKHALGRFRIYTTKEKPERLSLDDRLLPSNILAAARKAKEDRNKKQKKTLLNYFRNNVWADYKKIGEPMARVKNEKKAYEKEIPVTMVMKEGKQRKAFILERGEYDKPGDKVERALPAFLPPMPKGQPMNRLGLANWIVDESNPLTARVWVNRTWQRIFGTGIVKSTENFGTQADYPTHPELLDWLAVEFQSPKHSPPVNGHAPQDWDMKALIKLLVTSATYRQSSIVSHQSMELDPENRLLSRGPRFRLDGETIRDQALAASGLLVQKIGGPSVRPYMPEGVWDETSVYGNLRNYKADKGEGRYRRTLYTIWKRTAAPPTMLLFDAPNRETCTINRSRTNTPLQALSLLNENTFVEAAQSLAKRMLSQGGSTPEERIAYAFERLTSRKPVSTETDVLIDGLNEDLEIFENDPGRARAFLSFVIKETDQSLSDQECCELAAYSLAANVILNLDEVVMKQ